MVMVVMMMMPGVCQGEEDCSDSEIQELQAEYNKCAVQMEYQFEERKDDSEDNTDDEVNIYQNMNMIVDDDYSQEDVPWYPEQCRSVARLGRNVTLWRRYALSCYTINLTIKV